MITYQEYHEKVVKNAKNDLCSPRLTFNWGYHAGYFDRVKWNVNKDMSNHFDPYYAAGYLLGQSETDYNNNSTAKWAEFCRSLSKEDLKTLANSIQESLIISREYLFPEKKSRDKFEYRDWKYIADVFIEEFPAASVQLD